MTGELVACQRRTSGEGQEAQEEHTYRPSTLEAMMPKKKSTILTADDDLQLLELVTLNLELEGYEALWASNGKQALELIERHRRTWYYSM